MWLWIFLGALLVIIVWVLWLIFELGTAMPVIATILIVLGVVGIWGAKKLLARRAARKLEAALAAQAASQANNARPERRAEIMELQKQLQEGIAAVKTSKPGGKLGAAALYHLPWYMIIGPPGAGKTTALKHSGMVFPTGNSSGGVRGVGGTRNCDWWFTNEAIILDTAGRYTTESDDRDEWLAFLAFLLKYRQKRPINGIIIAISISELLDANEAQIETIGKKLRARIDEVITQLHMVVPVYLLFTKIDLIAGFSEFFGDLKKSDRAHSWGSTIPVPVPKNEPGKLFDGEFDLLVKHLHARALKRCVQERSRESREKLFQFPLEFAGIKHNLSELIAVTFAPDTFQGTPLFRGFYFTSGTQEGKPMDRVLERMSAAMGIRPQAAAAAGAPAQPNIESKSYFLYDLFINIIFKDGDVGVRSAIEVRKQMMLKLAIAAATLVIAGLLCLPAMKSYANNRAFLDDAQKRTKTTASLKWEDDTNLSKKVPLLQPSLSHLRDHDKLVEEGAPWGMRWWMYQADKVYQPTLKVYATQLQRGFVNPCKTALHDRLETANPDKYLQVRTALKQYLMLREIDHLDVEWATGRYTSLWVELMKGKSDVTSPELRDLMRPHVQYYFELLKRGKVQPPELDDVLIERVRIALQTIPVDQRYYEMFVNSLNDERIDEAGEPTIANMVFPPIQLPMIFPDRDDVKKYFQSKSFLENNGYKQVDGPYTDKGHYGVVDQLKAAEGMLQSEAWVVALTKEETPGNIPKFVVAVKTRYEERYIQEWLDFFADIQVRTPTTTDETVELFNAISTLEYPHRRLLQVLEDHTQWRNANPLESNDAIAREANRRFNQKLNLYTSGIVINFDLREIGKKLDKVPTKFTSVTKFHKGPKKDAQGHSKVFLYTELVKKLREKIEQARVKPREKDAGEFSLLEMNDDLDLARKEAAALLKDYDGTAVLMIKPLLMAPLNFGVKPEAGEKTQVKPTDKQPFKWGQPRPPGG